MAADYRGLEDKLSSADTAQSLIAALKPYAQSDPKLAEILARVEDNPRDYAVDLRDARNWAFSQDYKNRLQESPAAEAGQQAKAIRSSPLYSDAGVKPSSNWMARALQRVTDLFGNFRVPRSTRRAAPLPLGALGAFLEFLFIGVIILVIGGFLYFAVRHFHWQRKLKRRAGALLEEDEPVRTADEWLALAEGLTKQGRYREAVRCLYLACLLRFDEAEIARFVRSETNWEHLARIQSSPFRPPDLDFLPATQSFDRVWYGFQVRGLEDVDQFRIWYGQVMMLLQKVAA